MLTASPNSIIESVVSLESAVIQRFWEKLRKNKENAIQNFWTEIERKETPIIEEITNDAENIICTFIFQGDEKTKSVSVNLPPFSRIFPEKFVMSQIEETDVWLTSVKLPVESRFIYSFVVNCPFQGVNPESPADEINAFQLASQNDSFNPKLINKSRSYLETPNLKPQKYVENRPNVEKGKVEQFTLKSGILKNERTLSVYTPPDFDVSKTYPLLILLDENIYLDEINAPTILDNLQAEKLIPPIITAFVGNTKREDELTCNPQFAEFINSELLEWLKTSYKISKNHANKMIGGASFGGLSAVFTGLCFPETFGKILSQSGSFWRNWESITAKLFERHFPDQKFYLDAGVYEIEQKKGTSVLETNRDLRDILQAKDCAINYQEFKGGHGAVNWRGTFADGLIYLTEDLRGEKTPIGNPHLF